MNKTACYFIFGDKSWPVESVARSLTNSTLVSAWIDGKGWLFKDSLDPYGAPRQSQSIAADFEDAENPTQAVQSIASFDIKPESVAIVGFEDPKTAEEVTSALKAKSAHIKILEVGPSDLCSLNSQDKRQVAWGDLVSSSVDAEVSLLTIQERVREIKSYLDKSERIAILLQDDPDPDGLAAALALRKVLERNSLSAPIVSFGSISRPENAAMSMLLDIEVETIRPEALALFDKVVMIDCQPSFFKDRSIHADVVIDHHPRVNFQRDNPPDIEEIREDLGSVSTLLTQFLQAVDMEPSQRLATALLYGIKSDTLHLNRQVSEEDLQAFVYLYRRMNRGLLRRIERPELPFAYLETLRKGLRFVKSKRSVSTLSLGVVSKEEWIAQAADFLMQSEGTQIAIVGGIFQSKVMVSVRNCNEHIHCGEIIKRLYDAKGAAGGHRSMAKAIVPQENWKEAYGLKSLSVAGMSKILLEDFQGALESEKV